MKQLVLFLLIFLILRFYLFYSQSPNYKEGQQVSFSTTLFSEPKISGRYKTFTANLENGERIFVSTPMTLPLHYGQKIKITGVIKSFKTKNLSNHTLRLTMLDPKIEIENKEQVLGVFYFFRQRISSFFQDTLPSNSAALLLGIVFGIKSEMPKNFLENLQASGVLHVIAASGMNVTMVGSFLSGLFVLIFRRRIALIVSIFGICFYAILSGLEPSIVRAGIMAIFAFSAQILGRQTLSQYLLFIAFFLMLFMTPYLIYDIGFQLSFLSSLGLLYLKPLFDNLFKGKDTFLKTLIFQSEVSTTLSAQIATLPLILINFGSYSFVSLIVNAFVLWTIPILMALGGLGALFGLIMPLFGKILLVAALPFLFFFEDMVNFFGKFKGFEIKEFPWQFSIGYYFLLIAVILKLRKN